MKLRNEDEVIEVESCKIIKWCGFLINTENFNFNWDYTRLKNIDEQTAMYHTNPGLNLVKTLKRSIGYKCVPLVLDNTINTPFNV
jgi:hypothetical protein